MAHPLDDPSELRRLFAEAVSGTELDDLRALDVVGLVETEVPVAPVEARDRHRRRAPRADVVTFRVRLALEDSSPVIWRRLDVPSDLTLDQLHRAIQAAFGWEDQHLHRFALGGDAFDRGAEFFLCPFEVEDGDEEGTPEWEVRLDEVLGETGDALSYCYDYGDSWDLEIVLEEVRPATDGRVSCVAGDRAAPPEDCGGLRTAVELAEVLFDPAHFDVAEVDRALRDPFELLRDSGAHPEVLDLLGRLRGTTVGDLLAGRLVAASGAIDLGAGLLLGVDLRERDRCLAPFTWFLELVGDDGLALTSAGYLRPADVGAAAAVVPAAADWIGTLSREVHTAPVLAFREALQALGLVRRLKGRLVLTRAGAAARRDPDRLWQQLAGQLPAGRDGSVERDAGWVTLLLDAVPDPIGSHSALADALTALGWRQRGEAPVDPYVAARAAEVTETVLSNVAVRSDRRVRSRSEVARALARAALRA